MDTEGMNRGAAIQVEATHVGVLTRDMIERLVAEARKVGVSPTVCTLHPLTPICAAHRIDDLGLAVEYDPECPYGMVWVSDGKL